MTVRNKSDILIKLSQGRGTKGIDRTVTLCYTECPPHGCYGGLLCLLQNIAQGTLKIKQREGRRNPLRKERGRPRKEHAQRGKEEQRNALKRIETAGRLF